MRIKHILLGLVAIVVLGVGYLYIAYLRPIPPFQPTGEYSVGATNFDFEFASQISGVDRKINVRAWYPSNATEGEINLVSSQRLVEKTVEFYNMPSFLAETEASLSFKDAPIANSGDKFPVIVFNHGFGSFAEQNTSNMQELASNGYIVLSLSHPETSLLTEYTDGSYVYNNPDLPAFVEQLRYEEAATASYNGISAALETKDNATNFAEYWQGMRTLAQNAPFANMQPFLRVWIEDSNALVNAIATNQAEQFPAIFAASMNSEMIGIFGHSLGGMTALATTASNANIKAAINLDGPFAFDEPLENTYLSAPTCMLMAEGIPLGGEVISMVDINTPLLETSDYGGCVAVFNGAWHMNFADLNYVSFLKLLPILGPVDQEKMGVELNHLLVNFFDRHLKGDDIPYAPVYDTIVEYSEF